MATTLNWNGEENATVKEAFIQDATNKAFTLTKLTSGKFQIESHLTGHEGSGVFDSESDAKLYADDLIVNYGIPQHGTQLGYQANAPESSVEASV